MPHEVEPHPAARPTRVAVLLTCHNRREHTLRCLDQLHQQRDLPSGVELQVFLVDDGSTDGTAAAVGQRFPQVHVIAGDGQLFWCGGMRRAMAAALQWQPACDYVLWLNDDTILHEDALARLLRTQHDVSGAGPASIIVGAVTDPRDGNVTYGGQQQTLLGYTRLIPIRDQPQRASTMNGNCVLIPRAIVDQVGNVHPKLTHLRGDLDYGLRAARAGLAIWVAPGSVGQCEANPVNQRWKDARQPIRQRLAALHHPKYAIREKMLFEREHRGWLGLVSPLAVYAYILLTWPLSWFGRPSVLAAAPERFESERGESR